MFNGTFSVPRLSLGDLVVAFNESESMKQRLDDLRLYGADMTTYFDWTLLLCSIKNYVALTNQFLSTKDLRNGVVFILLFVSSFAFMMTVLLIQRSFRAEIRSLAHGASQTSQLACEIEDEKRRSALLQREINNQAQIILQLRSSLTNTQSILNKQQNSNASQANQIKSLNESLKAQKTLIHNMTVAATKRNASLKAATAATQAFQQDISSLRTAATKHTNIVQVYRQEVSVLETEIDLLKAIDGRVPAISKFDRDTFAAFAVPFVLVVVDGDAYSWCTSHFEHPDLSAGRYAAHAIKIEVQRYLLQHKESIPLHSRIVTRVFTNLRDSRHMKSASVSFPRQFSESMPLFDFVNCGGGKERADSKIQGSSDEFCL